MSSPSPFSQPYNYSLHAIPAAYVFALSPQLYVFARAMKASNYTATNITPRLNIDNLKGKINNNTWQALVRARGAHLNALEGFGIFGIAMIAGNVAKLPTKDLNLCAAEYFAARVVYTTLYMTVRSEAASYLRSAAYVWSLGIPVYVLWKAGNRLAERI